MPMYEYQCSKCKVVVEEMQKFSDAPLTDCEKCGAKGTLSKLISKSSFALKGTGWYTTDYKRKSSATASPADSSPAAPTSSSPSSATVSAPPATTKSAGDLSPSKSNKAD